MRGEYRSREGSFHSGSHEMECENVDHNYLKRALTVKGEFLILLKKKKKNRFNTKYKLCPESFDTYRSIYIDTSMIKL